ncbi:MAG: YHS domain-containing (seleno)protein [Phycisphaerales bacterium]
MIRTRDVLLTGLMILTLSGGAMARQEAAKPPAAPAPTAPPAPAAPATPKAETPKPDDGTDPAVKRETKHYNSKAGKPAIDGYDPVAYFSEGGGAAKKGDKQFAFTYRGVLYHFASTANLETFKRTPRKYEPAYGGWCAYAMGKTGEKVEVDPRSFRVREGRLYLFYTDFFTDTREKWVKDESALNPKADTSWKKTSGEDAPAMTEPKKEPEPTKK